MSSCLSGGGRTYGFDLEIVKSRSTSPRTSQTSSPPTSTISESSNSPLSISTRKPRTPRKRPNQTYNEAAALLSRVYPSIFPASNLHEFSKLPCEFFLDEPGAAELFLPFRSGIDGSGNFLPIHDKPRLQTEQKQSPSGEIQSKAADLPEETPEDLDFDAESIILDEEIEEGIDSIMGNSPGASGEPSISEPASGLPKSGGRWEAGHGMGARIGSIRAWKRAEEMSYWWNFPTVDVLEISPKLSSAPNPLAEKKKAATKKKSKKKAEKVKSLSELKTLEPPPPPPLSPPPKQKEEPTPTPGLMLKLDYDGVLGAWSGKGSPFSDEAQGSDAPAAAADVSARLAQIDLFSENDIVREASVLRYKEKRRNRLFSKKIRYQVRKVNADQRPRMKGRFVRGTNPTTSDQR